MNTSMRILAASADSWGGLTVGLVAAGIFVLFAAWIVVQRIRHGKDTGEHSDNQ